MSANALKGTNKSSNATAMTTAMTRKTTKKASSQKTKTTKKNGGEQVWDTDGHYCKRCGHNKTHDSANCYILKRLAKEKDNPGDGGKAQAKPFSKRTFRKEVNAMARRAGKNDGLKLVASALKCEQGKEASRSKNK